MPKTNQMLHFQIASSDEKEAAVVYKARIADTQEDGLLIEVPIAEETGRYKRLFLGDELSVFFVTNDGIKNYFDSHVLGFLEDGIHLIKISMPDPERITKVQRRSFLRVAAELELAVKTPQQARFISRTDDVGGGGISFICEAVAPIEVGQALECWLLIPYRNGLIEHASFKAEIVRIVELVTGRKQAMIKFVEINDYERQKIIRYCFERQLEFRNR